MENAARALLIAGGILIAIIIITMLLMMFNRVANMRKTEEEQVKLEQLAAFNAEFKAYDKKIMYGVDVISLINKVAENNKKYAGNNAYQISVSLDGVSNPTSSSLIGDREKYIYSCESIRYNDLGRVSEIKIVSRETD